MIQNIQKFILKIEVKKDNFNIQIVITTNKLKQREDSLLCSSINM